MSIANLDLFQARKVAESVADPELPMVEIGDLGMVRGVHRDGETVVVVFTPTYSGCPATELIQQDILHALSGAGFDDARIEVRRSPAWSTDWITSTGQQKLKAAGIAPPAPIEGPTASSGGRASAAVLPIFGERRVGCPQCGSTETERLAEHGSTPCKALYRCLRCREPFDHFKCH